MLILSALLTGIIFGLGLILSGMTNPEKVIGFLDIAGNWDPSLMFVMIGAILVGFIAFRTDANREKSLLGEKIDQPQNTRIDQRLIIGSILFGIGWGLAGFCPGPAIASIMTLGSAGVFVLAMLVGIVLFKQLF